MFALPFPSWNYFIICHLFNDDFSMSDYISPNESIINKLERYGRNDRGHYPGIFLENVGKTNKFLVKLAGLWIGI